MLRRTRLVGLCLAATLGCGPALLRAGEDLRVQYGTRSLEAALAFHRAFQLFEQTKYEEALPELEKALAADKQFPLARYCRGHTLLKLGRLDDGLVTAEEIVSLDLHRTELVTLSACETGLGDVAAGEGVFGLQRAFHQAGVRTVVASLWKVDDEATRALMTEFYRNLWGKKLGKLEALRQAQLAVLNGQVGIGGKRGPSGDLVDRPPPSTPSTSGRADPRLWAAWVLSGGPWGERKPKP